MDKTRYFMLNIDRLLNQVIPYPDDREHRDGFSNEQIIDELNDEAKKLLADGLIEKLVERPDDLLIVTTLAYLKSEKSLDRLYELLNHPKHQNANKATIASSIYKIRKDEKLIDIALTECIPLTNWWNLISVFYPLAEFKNKKSDDFIGKHFDHKDYLVSYNAKRAIDLNKT
jgi:hypothetical protein